jgi:OmpA-OmpF porin, OOP family
MKPIITSLLIGLMIASVQVNAQKAANDLSKMSTAKKIKEGDYLFKQGSYYNAIPYYQSVYSDDNTNAYAVNQVAQCELWVRDYQEGEKWFKTLVDMKNGEYPLALYYYGRMLKFNAKYDLAKQAFQNFIKTYMGDNSVQYKKLAQAQIDGCDLAVKMMANPLKVRITHLGTTVNGPYTELSPMPIGDSLLLYASLKSDTVIKANADNKFTQYAEFYISQKTDSNYAQGVLYPGPFNSDDSHTGNGSFSPDGQHFYFTRCNPDQTLRMVCDIYFSQNQNGKWSDPQKLPDVVNAPGSSNTQPTVGEAKDGEVLYFVSDRPNGYGGKDIWFSVRDKSGNYDQPKNLGKKINTGGDEVTPYYDNDNKILYYSSDGEVGMGGFDIFRSKGEENKFDNPENLGYPINSADDDMYFVLDKNKRGGYLVSNRPGTISLKNETCCDDIWRFDYIRKIYYVVKGNVYNQDTPTQIIPGARIALLMDNAEIASGTSRADSPYHYNLMPGKSFVLKADKDGYFAGTSTTINVVKKEENDTMRVNVYLKKIPHAAIRVANIYYDFNMATLRPESITGLDSLYQIMVDNPSLIVEIGSHTDSKGTHEYNVKLSQARAQSVVDFLINKGISKDRLVAKGYAETEPIAPNTINGKDNPEGRQMNRRTEFKIIGTIPNTEIIYKQGNPNFNPNENDKSTNEEPNFFKINKDNSDSTQAH